MSTAGALAGIVVGEAIVVPLALGSHDPFHGINAGLIGLVANVIVNVVVSRAWPSAEIAGGDRFRRSTQVSDQPAGAL
jgi:SSS family solute:Na+ symporter